MSETNGKVDADVRKSFQPGARKWHEIATHWDSSAFSQTFPAIHDLLCNARNAEGKWRPGASMIFFAEGGTIKCSLYDKQTQQVCFVTLEGEMPWLEQVEEYLQGGADWRPRKR